MTDRDRGDRI
jgi:hypothetical protein